MDTHLSKPFLPLPDWVTRRILKQKDAPFTRAQSPREESKEKVFEYAFQINGYPHKYSVPKHLFSFSNTDMTDSVLSPWNISSNSAVHLNVNRLHEYLDYQQSLFMLQRGVNLQAENIDVIPASGFSFHKWLSTSFSPYTMFEKNVAQGMWRYGSAPTERVAISARLSKSGLEIDYDGSEEGIGKFKDWISTQGFSPKEIMIEWAFGKDYSQMETYDLPLNIRPDLPGAYPWMKESTEDYSRRYMDSHESVLVLKGAPGTGKTSFIKKLIQCSGGSARVTYDAALLTSDGFFADFMMRDNTNILVVEDADQMLLAREEGNHLMDRLLNASDGLVSLRHKKIVFSTNLGNVSSIDPALLRKGRCFDILDFRKLDQDEAKAVATHLYKEPIEFPKGKYSLAEVTNLDRESLKIAAPILKPGFIG